MKKSTFIFAAVVSFVSWLNRLPVDLIEYVSVAIGEVVNAEYTPE